MKPACPVLCLLFAMTAGTADAHPFADPRHVYSGDATPHPWLVTTDLDRDGHTDLVYPGLNGSTAVIVRGTAGGGFDSGQLIGALGGPSLRNVVAADLNQDGRTDLVAYEQDLSGAKAVRLRLHVQQADHSFLAAAAIPLTGVLAAGAPLAAADLDRDGRLDLVAATNNAATGPDNDFVQWFRNDGFLQFAPGANIGVGHDSPRDLVIVDFDHNGAPDVAVADFGNSRVRLVHGPTFTISHEVVLGSPPKELAAADIDADGWDDFFVLAGGSGLLDPQRLYRVRNEQGALSVNSALQLASAVGTTYRGLAVAGLDGDRLPDALFVGTTGRQVEMALSWPAASGYQADAAAPVGAVIEAVHPADFDGDGDQDLFLTTSEGVLLQENLSPRRQWTTLYQATRTPGPNGTRDMVAADMDRDGDSDIVCVAGDTGAVVMYPFNAAARQIQSAVSLPGVANAHAVAVGDLNRDGHPDLVTANGAGQVGVHLQAPTWTTITLPGKYATDLAVEDLNRDGRPDIVAGSDGDGAFALLNTGNMNNWTPLTMQSSGIVARIEVADVYPGGWLEAVIKRSDNSVALLVRNTMGAWAATELFPADDFSSALAVADIDADGRLDVASATGMASMSELSWQRQQSDLTFTRGVRSFGMAGDNRGLRRLTFADVDRDGRADWVFGRLRAVDVVRGTYGDGYYDDWHTLVESTETTQDASEISDVVVGDFGGDASPDFALVRRDQGSTPRVEVYLSAAPQVSLAGGPLLPQSAVTPATVLAGTEAAALRVEFTHHGKSSDLPAQLDRLEFTFTRLNGLALTAAEMSQLFSRLDLRQDSVNPGQVDAADALVGTMTSFAPVNGTLMFGGLSPAPVLPAEGKASFHLLVRLHPSAGAAAVTSFRVQASIPYAHEPTQDTSLSTSGAAGDRNASLALAGTTGIARFQVGSAGPLQTWRMLHFGTHYGVGPAANDQDPDGDGVSNIFEYLTSGNPKAKDALVNTKGVLTQVVGGLQEKVKVEARLLASVDPTVKVRLRMSHNAGWWETLATRQGSDLWTGVAPTETVLAGGRKLFSFTTPVRPADHPEYFFRLEAEETP